MTDLSPVVQTAVRHHAELDRLLSSLEKALGVGDGEQS